MELCIALDLPGSAENMRLAESLAGFDNLWMKIGLRSYIRDGRDFIDTIKQINPNFKIFLDLKLYDIPNTMADAAEEIANLGVEMFNIHASAGIEAMNAVMKRLEDRESRPLVLAVTALTSFDNEQFKAIYGESIDERVDEWAADAYNCGLDGVVCSAFESRMIKASTNPDFITLSPGIRPFGEDAGDQKRVATIELAKEELVDFPVIGRPVYKSENPALQVSKILEIMNDNS